MPDHDHVSESYARSLNAADPLARFRERFFIPSGTIYLDGNLPILRGFWGQGDLLWENQPSTIMVNIARWSRQCSGKCK